MANTCSDDYVVVTNINLNKQPLANMDLALYISYLSKGFHLDQNDVIRGMDAYKTEFRYELSKEAVSEDEEEEELTPSYNMFARRGGDPSQNHHRGHQDPRGRIAHPPWNRLTVQGTRAPLGALPQ